MFDYVFKHQIKTDEDYKKYQLFWFPLTVLFILSFILIGFKILGPSDEIWGGAIGGLLPMVIYGIWLMVVFNNPKKLRAARLRLTDERRKIVEQEVWSHVGRLMMGLLTVALLYTVISGAIILDTKQLTILLYLILIYYFFRLRK